MTAALKLTGMRRQRLLTGFEHGTLEAVDDKLSYKGPDSLINLTPRSYASARNRVTQHQPIAKADVSKASKIRTTFVAWQAIDPDRAGLEFLSWNQVFSYYSSMRARSVNIINLQYGGTYQ